MALGVPNLAKMLVFTKSETTFESLVLVAFASTTLKHNQQQVKYKDCQKKKEEVP